MPVAFVKSLGTNDDKVNDATLSIAVASLSVATGNTIFLAIAYEPGGTVSTVTTTGATVSWGEVVNRENVGQTEAALWKGDITAGGTVTAIDITFAAANAAKAAVAGEFSDVGTLIGTATSEGDGVQSASAIPGGATVLTAGQLMLAATSKELNGDTAGGYIAVDNSANHVATLVGFDGTTGGGSTSNQSAVLTYIIVGPTPSNGYTIGAGSTTTGDLACATAAYDIAAAAGPMERTWQNEAEIYDPALARAVLRSRGR